MGITTNDVFQFFLNEAGVQRKEYEAKMSLSLEERLQKRIAIDGLLYDATFQSYTAEGHLRKLIVDKNISDFKVGEYMILHTGDVRNPLLKCQLYDFLENGDLIILVSNYEATNLPRLEGTKSKLTLDKDLPDLSRVYISGASCIKDENLYIFNERPQPSFCDLELARKNLQETIDLFGFTLTPRQREAAENALATKDYYLIHSIFHLVE